MRWVLAAAVAMLGSGAAAQEVTQDDVDAINDVMSIVMNAFTHMECSESLVSVHNNQIPENMTPTEFGAASTGIFYYIAGFAAGRSVTFDEILDRVMATCESEPNLSLDQIFRLAM